MKKCCKHELNRYRQALDLARCEIIHCEAFTNYLVANKISWAIGRANVITKNWRNGLRGSKAWTKHLPKLSAVMWPIITEAVKDKE